MKSHAQLACLAQDRRHRVSNDRVRAVIRFVAASSLALTSVPGLSAQRSQLKAPWNMYSPQTDVQVVRQNAQLMERRLPLCNDAKVDAYLTQLGLKLADKLPTRGAQYPGEVHCFHSNHSNAFA